ncbi:MAG: hypothetical protein HYV07_33830 [Deltaproteobacteria bacterium]|nr:hypothetical protein [Deltaproteobacteria bacterium]
MRPRLWLTRGFCALIPTAFVIASTPSSMAQTAESSAAVLRAAWAEADGAPDQAADELRRALVFDPGSPWLMARAVQLQGLGLRLDRLADRALELDGRSPRGWLAAARAQHAAQHLGRAERSYRTAIRLDRSCQRGTDGAELDLARLSMERDRVAEAERILARSVRRCSSTSGALALGRLLAGRGKLREALEAYKATPRSPRASWASTSDDWARTVSPADREVLAVLLLDGRFEDARALAAGLGHRDPEDPEVSAVRALLVGAPLPTREAADASARSLFTTATADEPSASQRGMALFEAFAEQPSDPIRALALAVHYLRIDRAGIAQRILRWVPRDAVPPPGQDEHPAVDYVRAHLSSAP